MDARTRTCLSRTAGSSRRTMRTVLLSPLHSHGNFTPEPPTYSGNVFKFNDFGSLFVQSNWKKLIRRELNLIRGGNPFASPKSFRLNAFLDETFKPVSGLGVEHTVDVWSEQNLLLIYPPHPTPYTLHPTPYILHPTPHTLHPTPHTLHPTPYTLHRAPYTLHPTPSTPHPKP